MQVLDPVTGIVLTQFFAYEPSFRGGAHVYGYDMTVIRDLAMLEPVKDYAQRHTSTLLAFVAAVEAVRQAASRTSAAGAA